jgi:hypothetical protein
MTAAGPYERPPLSVFTDDSCWIDLPTDVTEAAAARAEAAVRALGLHSPWASYSITPLGGELVQVRVVNPGAHGPVGGSPSWLVSLDDRVYEIGALPGTWLAAAEEVLTARYADPRPVDDDEAAILQTRIRVLAIQRSWGG